MTESKIKKIDSMIKQLREMKSDLNRMQKLSDKDYRDLTPKQSQKISADKDWIGMDLIKRGHELHALAVELGLSERRDTYDTIQLRDNWHVFNYKPREPNAA
jgi:hypothetical protein